MPNEPSTSPVVNRKKQTFFGPLRSKEKNEIPEMTTEESKTAELSTTEQEAIEDEVILDFLRYEKKEQFLERNCQLIDRNVLSQTLTSIRPETIRGRPRADRQKISLYVNSDFLRYLEDYTRKNMYLSVQDAIRSMLREQLVSKGYSINQEKK